MAIPLFPSYLPPSNSKLAPPPPIRRQNAAGRSNSAFPSRLSYFLAVEASWEQRTRSYVALSGPDELPSSSDGREDYEHKRLCKAHRQQQADDTMGQKPGYRWSVGCLRRPSILPSPTAAPSPPTTTSPTSSTSTIPPSKPGTFPTELARSLDSRRLFFGSPHPRLVCVMGHSRELCGLL